MTEGAPQEFTDREIKNIVDSVEDTTKSESNPKPSEKFGTAFKRKIAAGIAAFTIATGAGAAATGCEYGQQATTIQTETTVESSKTEPVVTTSENGTSVKVDPVGTTETTKAPTPVETTAPPTETTVETTETIKDPKIPGAKIVEKDNKTILVAEAGNDLGLKEGEYIGEYKENVYINGEKVGSWALIPSEAQKLLNEELAKIPEGKPKLKIILPVTDSSDNKIDIVNISDDLGSKMLAISSDSNMNVFNTIPNSEDFYVAWFDYEGLQYGSSLYTGTEIADASSASNETIMYFLQTSVTESDIFNSETVALKAPFGSVFAKSEGENVYVSCGDMKGSYDVSTDSILRTKTGKVVSISFGE